MNFIERKYILLLSNRFRNFKQKENHYNFSCPYCGDSHKNKFKARGYLLQKGAKWMYYCHNCGATRSFDKFLEEQDVGLYGEYRLEKLKDSSQVEVLGSISNTTNMTSAFPGYRQRNSPLRKLKKVSQLDWDHPVKKYILERKIPNRYHAKLFLCPKFYAWTNKLVPGKFKKVTNDEQRLIIPFLDKDGKFFGYQGRSLSKESSLRYITIMLDESRPKLYGLDDVNSSKSVYVVEGPIDSMFVNNCIAMAGSDVRLPYKNVVMIYDNEPRSREIVKKIEKSIDMGRKVVVWPSKIQYKDINDMIMNGYSKADIDLILSENTHEGLSAKMALSVWKKV